MSTYTQIQEKPVLDTIIEIAAGGGVAVASGFVGNIMGFARGRAERNIAALFVTGTPDSLWCVCGHALSFHKGSVGTCHRRRAQQEGRHRLRRRLPDRMPLPALRRRPDAEPARRELGHRNPERTARPRQVDLMAGLGYVQ